MATNEKTDSELGDIIGALSQLGDNDVTRATRRPSMGTRSATKSAIASTSHKSTGGPTASKRGKKKEIVTINLEHVGEEEESSGGEDQPVQAKRKSPIPPAQYLPGTKEKDKYQKLSGKRYTISQELVNDLEGRTACNFSIKESAFAKWLEDDWRGLYNPPEEVTIDYFLMALDGIDDNGIKLQKANRAHNHLIIAKCTAPNISMETRRGLRVKLFPELLPTDNFKVTADEVKNIFQPMAEFMGATAHKIQTECEAATNTLYEGQKLSRTFYEENVTSLNHVVINLQKTIEKTQGLTPTTLGGVMAGQSFGPPSSVRSVSDSSTSQGPALIKMPQCPPTKKGRKMVEI